MAGLDFLLGAQGDDANAARMGLLSAGLGILANNSGHYGAAGPALASGAMTGLQGYQGALDQQAQNRANAFKMQQQQAALEAAQRQQAYRQSIASGQEKFDPNRALAAGIPIEEIRAIGEFPNIGKAEIKEYKEIRGPDGAVTLVGYDKFGNAVNTGATPFKAPTYQDLGGQVVGIDPITGKQVTVFGKSMTPGEIASNAVARANLGISAQRLAMDRDAAKGQVIQTENGPMLIDTRTGIVRPAIGPDGRPLANAKEAQASAQRSRDATDALGLIDMAGGLIDKSTGSYIGAGYDTAAQAFGLAPAGAQAAAQLKAIEGMLVSKMPKMSGPQSDKDVLLYKQMAGQIGDPTIPNATKKSALETIKAIQQRYAGVAPATPNTSSGGGWSAKRID